MRALLRFTLFILFVFAMVAGHIGFAYILPYPYSKINFIFSVLTLFLIFRESGSVVWLSFAAHFFIELYTTTPFGIILASGTLSMLCAFWLYQFAFTNHSWYTAAAVSISSLVIYRLLFIFGIFLVALANQTGYVSLVGIISSFAWELLFSTLFTSVVYALLMLATRNRRIVKKISWS